jgi:hypothetical protein
MSFNFSNLFVSGSTSDTMAWCCYSMVSSYCFLCKDTRLWYNQRRRLGKIRRR